MFYRFLLILIILTNIVIPSFTENINIIAESAILIDGNTGQILYEKNINKKMYPASTTKILTALIILENHSLDEIVTIDKDTPFTTGSRIYVIEGEKFTVEQLLYALMLPSANDAAVALAKFHSKTTEEFAKVMNQRAKEIGALSSNFVNPNGLPSNEHYTTTYDMSLIAKEAMKNETFRKIVSTTKYQIKPTNKQSETRYLTNSNKFLYATGNKNKINYKGKSIDIKYENIIGIKTGYTDIAGQCFVAAIDKDGKYLISVILKSQGKNLYIDSRTLLDYGVDNFKYKNVLKKGDVVTNINFNDKKIPIYTDNDINALIPKNSSENIKKVIDIYNLKPPFTAEQIIGELSLNLNDNTLRKIYLKVPYEISNKPLLSSKTINLSEGKNKITKLDILFVLLKLLLALFIWRIIMTIINIIKYKFKKKFL